MKVFILDDEKDSRDILNFLLESTFPELEIAGEANNIAETCDFLNNNFVDLLFFRHSIK